MLRKRVAFWIRRRSDEDFAMEVESHLAMEVERLVQSGMTPVDAEHAARRAFGNTTTRREQFHEHHSASRWEWLMSDVKYGMRGLRRSPLFTAIAVVSLALGIGANITMFGVVDALLLSTPSAVQDAPRLRRVYTAVPDRNGEILHSRQHGYRTYAALRDNVGGFESIAAFAPRQISSGRGAEARAVNAVLVSPSFFSTLGVRPALGRFFAASEERDDGTHVAVLGHNTWRVSYAADSTVLGRTIDVAGTPYVIVGVAPRNFDGIDLNRADVWLPLGFATTFMNARAVTPQGTGYWLQIVAKLRPDASDAQVAREGTKMYRDSWRDAPMYEQTIGKAELLLGSVMAARGPIPDPNAKVSVWVAAVSILVLLIACANVANLLLLRGLARARETALRLSLGASRWRIVRQALVEGMLVAVGGAACAVALAQWSSRAVYAFLLPDAGARSVFEPQLLAITAVLAVVTGMLASLVPALVATRRNPGPLLGAGRVVGGAHRLFLQRALIGGQVALATILLVGAGLFVSSLRNVRAIDLGLDVPHLLYVQLDLRSQLKGADATKLANATYSAILDRVRRVPGVASATVSAGEPLTSGWGLSLILRGAPRPEIGSPVPLARAVGGDYFKTMGTALRRGRLFTAADHVYGAHVAIVDEAAAEHYWPGGDPLDPCVQLGDASFCTEIIGVVANTVQWEVTGASSFQVYVPIESVPTQAVTMMEVRTHGDPAASVSAIRQAITSVSPDLPWADIRSVSDRLGPQYRPWRLGASMFTAYGVLALFLAAVGLYGLLSYVVAQRSHEIGVRKALGAPSTNVLRMILRWGLGMSVVGVATGILVSVAAGRLVSSRLYGISARDPLVIAICGGSLLAMAALASLLPAIRATRIDPMEMLRGE